MRVMRAGALRAYAVFVGLLAMQRMARADADPHADAALAKADPHADASVAIAAAMRVPDASLQAGQDHVVRLELDGAPSVEGRLLGFEAMSVTLATSGTNQVVTLGRDKLARLFVVDPAAPAPVVETEPEPERMIGAQFSLLGTVAAD